MSRKLLSILLFFILGFGLSPLHAKVVHGIVRNSEGNPLDVVGVELVGTAEGTYTNPAGHFMLELPADTFKMVKLHFSLVGFKDTEKTLRVDGDSVYVNVVMSVNNVELNSFDVVAQRKQETTVDVIKVDVSKSVPSVSGDGVVSIVTTMPGVSSTNELSSQYSVRGGNYDENCVYVNSVEVYRPFLIRSGEQEGLSFINQDLVESVSFSSGGFGPEYGDKTASVLDVKYKTPSSFEGSASLSFLGASAYVGSSSEKFSQVHGFRYKTSSYFLKSLETEGEYKPNFLDYQCFMTYRFTHKWELSFLGNISRNDYNFIPESKETSFGTLTDAKKVTFYFDGQEKDLFTTFFGSLSLKYKPSKRLSLALTGSSFHTSEKVTYDITSEYLIGALEPFSNVVSLNEGIGNFHEHARNFLDATVTSIAHIGSYELEKNKLKWGLTYQLEHVGEDVNEWEYRDSAGYSLPVNWNQMSLYDNLNGDLDEDMHRLSVFGQNAFTFYSNRTKMVLLGGFRASYWSFNKQFTVSPRVSMAWFPKGSKWGFRFATGIYHQALFFKEMLKVERSEEGNVNLFLNHDVKSPRSTQIIAASDYYFRKWGRPFKFTTELYYKYLDRIIPYKVDNMSITYLGENCADGFAFGGDVKLFGEFVPGTDSWISFSLMNTKENIYGDGEGFLPRPTDQRFNISMFFQDYMPGFEKLKFNIKLVWSDGFPFTRPNEIGNRYDYRTKNYKRVDIGVAYQFIKGREKLLSRKAFSWMKSLSLNLDFFNLLGTKNVNSYYWISVVDNQQYAVPNYLTGRLFNFKIAVDF